MIDTAAIAIAGGVVPIKFSIDIESALDGLKSVGKLTNEQIVKIGKQLKELSREIPLSAVELV
ncbi:MAG: hypothetical protein PG981_001480 [Wolbachia endosymbiont of Ctenocephalides orientis wCori]|nr:MAG: hypothetical protein PG981_001480 [Wolbachia endosymbiont of Ctenocephalides orientis wCori]